MKSVVLGAMTAAMLIATPAFAGEITGSGKDLPINGNSACAFSGLNDTPDGLWLPIGPGGALVQVDPGGHTQSYGSFMSSGFLRNPSDPTAREGTSGGFPGANCSPGAGGGQ